MKSVYLTVPNGDGWVHKTVHFATCRLLADRRYLIRHDAPTHIPYENNLAHCANDFLNGGEQYWLSIDSDNAPRKNPLDLVELDLDLIILPTPVWHNAIKGDRPYYYNVLTKTEEGYRPFTGEGLQEIDAGGSGCFLVARRVILALKDKTPFQRRWNPDGTMEMSGDFMFCEKVKAAGFRVFTHTNFLCHHVNELNLLEMIQAFGSMK